MTALRILSLFCGAGGIDEGIRQAGHRTKTAVDSDPDCCDTMRANHPGTETVCSTVGDALRDGILDRRYDAVVGGPPCQPHSLANHQRDNNPENIDEFVDVARTVGAHILFIENVPGAVPVLDKLPYNLYRIDTADYGVPQNRPRVISTTLPLPRPTHSKYGNGTLDATPHLKRWVSVADALGLDGIMQDHKWGLTTKPRNRSTDRPARTILAGSREWIVSRNNRGSGNWNKKRPVTEPSYALMTGARFWLMRSNATTTTYKDTPVDDLDGKPDGVPSLHDVHAITAKNPKFVKKHPFIDPRRPSSTLLAKHDHSITGNMIRDGDLARKLTMRELATLQGFPESYVFVGSGGPSKIRQIGNALPPAISRAFFRQVPKTRRKAKV